MILFMILAIMALVCILCTVAIVGVAGGVGLILASDLIVCVGLIGFIIWLIFFRKKKNKEKE